MRAITVRELAFRVVTLVAYAVIVVAALILTVLRELAIELGDEVRASRHETDKRIQGWTMPKNRKVPDLDSTMKLRAANAVAAANLGDAKRVLFELAEARFYAEKAAALPVRRAS